MSRSGAESEYSLSPLYDETGNQIILVLVVCYVNCVLSMFEPYHIGFPRIILDIILFSIGILYYCSFSSCSIHIYFDKFN